MKTTEAVTSRRSVRAFIDKPVEIEKLQRVLEKAQISASGGNTQPWSAILVTGDHLTEISTKIKEKAKAAPAGEDMEYAIYPKELGGRYDEQRRAIGKEMFAAMQLERDDVKGRAKITSINWESFGAPVQLFTYCPKYMGRPQWSDMGMWLQTVMILLREEGLDSCAQEIWAMYGTYMRQLLNIDDDHIFFCGMAIGYRDENAPINNFERPRADLNDVIRWEGF